MTNRYPFRFTPPPVPIQTYIDAMNRDAAELAQRTQLRGLFAFDPPKPATPKRGDLVEMRATRFYVGKVNADGTYQLAETRDAFPEPVTLDRCHRSRLKVVEPAPAEPKVGDTITAATLRATPWQRGTLIRYALPEWERELLRDSRAADDVGRYVLASDGMWTAVEDGTRHPFGHLYGEFVVEHAPGK